MLAIDEALYIGLLFECPCGKATVNCPFNAYRGKNGMVDTETFLSLDPIKRRQLIKYHQRCLSSREVANTFHVSQL